MDRYKRLMGMQDILVYPKGVIDFSGCEGGNNHIVVFESDFDTRFDEIGHMLFDTHCLYYGYTTKSEECCSGIFRELLPMIDPDEWNRDDMIFQFTVWTMDQLITKIERRLS